MDTTIINFGKYKGSNYEQVLNKNRKYCAWLGCQLTESEEVKDFQKWLITKGIIEQLPEKSANHNQGK